MLGIIRRFQRSIYIVIAVVVVFTFVFFGTSSLSAPRNSSQRSVVMTLDSGKKIYDDQLTKMVHFINVETGTLEGDTINPVNQGWLSQLFLESGLVYSLYQKHETWSQVLKNKLDFEQRWRPYQHKAFNFLSLENAWSYFSPNLKQIYNDFKVQSTSNLDDVLKVKVRAYLTQRQTSPIMLANLLAYQEKMALSQNGLNHLQDQNLSAERLTLFGYRNLSDWFGRSMVEDFGRIIFQAADKARSLGYDYSLQEARDLWLYDMEQAFERSNLEKEKTDFSQWVLHYKRNIGLEDREIAKVYQELLLCRDLLMHQAQFLICDDTLAQNMNEWAGTKLIGNWYVIPNEYRVQNFQKWQYWHEYIQRTCDLHFVGGVQYPLQLKPAHEVLKQYPEMIEKSYRLAVRRVSLPQLLASYSHRQWLQWQCSEDLWRNLQEKIPSLRNVQAQNFQDRSQAILSVAPSERNLLDITTVAWFVESEKQKFQDLIKAQAPSVQTYTFALAGSTTSLDGIVHPKALCELLDSPNYDPQEVISQDGQHYYLIDLLESQGIEVLSFARAQQEGILEAVAELKLQNHYEDMIGKNSPKLFKVGSKDPLPLAQAKAIVAADLYHKELSQLKKVLAELNPNISALNIETQRSADLLCRGYWAPYIEYYRAIKHEGGHLPMADEMKERKGFIGFDLQNLQLTREQSAQYGDDLFTLKIAQTSSPMCSGEFVPGFFELNGIIDSEEHPWDLIDAQKNLGQKLLGELACERALETTK